MIPQAQVHWFSSQSIWCILSFCFIYFMNHVAYRYTLNEKRARDAHKILKEREIEDMEKLIHTYNREISSIIAVYREEERLTKEELSMQAKIDFNNECKKHVYNRHAVDEKLRDWIQSQKVTESDLVAKFLKVSNERI